MNSQSLYFDIETVPDYDRAASFPLDPVPPVPDEAPIESLPDPALLITCNVESIKSQLKTFGCCPPAYLNAVIEAERAAKGDKSRAGVLDAIAAARNFRQAAVDAHEDRRRLLSTTPEYCRIAAIGWGTSKESIYSAVLGQGDGTSEAELLEALWELIRKHSPLIGYHCIGFDLPVILARSAILGVGALRRIDLNPYSHDVVDMYVRRFGRNGNGDKQRPGKLKSLARVYGIEVPAGDCDGSQVERLLKTNPAKLGEYVRSDVSIAIDLHEKLSGLFWD